MPAAQRPDWSGRTVACIASGPSLTREDCEAVRGLTTVVTNTSFRLAPWADALFGFDSKWWREHVAEVNASGFKGRRFSTSMLSDKLGLECIMGTAWCRQYGNSGACAISLAIGAGAHRVILLGFDCAFALDGRKHWHGDHPNGFSNCASIKRWPEQFKKVAEHAQKNGCQVLNASRETALRCFPRVALADALPVLQAA